jgi:hypothetical protein
MLSLLPGYRRSTRYKSSDGSSPRFLALHEIDDANLDPRMMNIILNTEWAKKVLGKAKILDTSIYQLFLERGNATEKLGTLPS